jgi:hypothetical protein
MSAGVERSRSTPVPGAALKWAELPTDIMIETPPRIPAGSASTFRSTSTKSGTGSRSCRVPMPSSTRSCR